jgi:hypothetical protein
MTLICWLKAEVAEILEGIGRLRKDWGKNGKEGEWEVLAKWE